MTARKKLGTAVYLLLLSGAIILAIIGASAVDAYPWAQSLFLNLATEFAGATLIYFVVNKAFGIEESSVNKIAGRIDAAAAKVEASARSIDSLHISIAGLQDALKAVEAAQASGTGTSAQHSELLSTLRQQLQAHLDEVQRLSPPVKRHVYAMDERRGVRDYMYDWIRRGGQVAIWTRDHSWVDDDEMRQLLFAKARKKELIICLPNMTPFCHELKKEGADVYAYGSVDGLPSTRFTVANFSHADSSVAIAAAVLGVRDHVIEEYDTGKDVTAALAYDVIRLGRALSMERERQ
ncbi:hypothetical protein WME91_51890 [Sorangium sp. So ce269]